MAGLRIIAFLQKRSLYILLDTPLHTSTNKVLSTHEQTNQNWQEKRVQTSITKYCPLQYEP